MKQARSAGKRSGFLTFVFVILLADLIIGFVYGYMRESPEKPHAAPKQVPDVSGADDTTSAETGHVATEAHAATDQTPRGDETDDEPVTAGGPDDPAEDLAGEPAEHDDTPATADDDPDSFRKMVEDLLGTEVSKDDPQLQQDHKTEDNPPEPASDSDTADVPIEATHDDNPEDDLYTFNSVVGDAPAQLSEETRKGNECLAKGKEMLLKWDKTREKGHQRSGERASQSPGSLRESKKNIPERIIHRQADARGNSTSLSGNEKLLILTARQRDMRNTPRRPRPAGKTTRHRPDARPKPRYDTGRPQRANSNAMAYIFGGALALCGIVVVVMIAGKMPGGGSSNIEDLDSLRETPYTASNRPRPVGGVDNSYFSGGVPSEAEDLYKEAHRLLNEAMAADRDQEKLKAAIGKLNLAFDGYHELEEKHPDDPRIKKRIQKINKLIYRANKSVGF